METLGLSRHNLTIVLALARRNFIGTYRSMYLGLAWPFIQSVGITVVFTLVLGTFLGVAPSSTPYPLFAYSGVITWQLFTSIVTSGVYTILNNASIVSTMPIRKWVVVASSASNAVINFLISLIGLVILLAYYGMAPITSIIIVPVCVTFLVLFGLGISFFTSVIVIDIRDLGIIVSLIMQAILFVTPILYPVSSVPSFFRGVYSYNPLFILIDTTRNSFLGGSMDMASLALAFLVSSITFLAGLVYLDRKERDVVDRI